MESEQISSLLFMLLGIIFLFFDKVLGFSLLAIGFLLLIFSKNGSIIEERKDLIKEKE